jgi:hypothetical protein
MKNYLLYIIAVAGIVTSSYGVVLFDQTTHIELPPDSYPLPVPLDFWVTSTSRGVRPGQDSIRNGLLFRYDDQSDPRLQLISEVFEGTGWRFASLLTPGYEVLLMDRVPLGEIASSYSLVEVFISNYIAHSLPSGILEIEFDARLRIEGELASVPETGGTAPFVFGSSLLLLLCSKKALLSLRACDSSPMAIP